MRVLIVATPGLEEPEIIKSILTDVGPTEVIRNDATTGVEAAVAEWCAANSIPEIVIPVDPERGAEAYVANIEEMLTQNPEVTLSFINEFDPWPIPPEAAGDRNLNIRFTNIFAPGTAFDDTDYSDGSAPRSWQTIMQHALPPDVIEPTGPTGP